MKRRFAMGVICILGFGLLGWLFPAESPAELVLNVDPATIQAGAVASNMRYRISKYQLGPNDCHLNND
jgi:hypothetical protein